MFAFPSSMILCSRTAGTGAYGNDAFTETQTTVFGAFAPGGSTEQIQGRDTVTNQPSVFLPPDTVVQPTDNIIVGGIRYLVDGSPNNWVNVFTGLHAGVEVKLLVTTG